MLVCEHWRVCLRPVWSSNKANPSPYLYHLSQVASPYHTGSELGVVLLLLCECVLLANVVLGWCSAGTSETEAPVRQSIRAIKRRFSEGP